MGGVAKKRQLRQQAGYTVQNKRRQLANYAPAAGLSIGGAVRMRLAAHAPPSGTAEARGSSLKRRWLARARDAEMHAQPQRAEQRKARQQQRNPHRDPGCRDSDRA